jgi:hypothetical protein
MFLNSQRDGVTISATINDDYAQSRWLAHVLCRGLYRYWRVSRPRGGITTPLTFEVDGGRGRSVAVAMATEEHDMGRVQGEV